MKKLILSLFFIVIILGCVFIPRKIIESKIAYKKAFVNNLYLEYNAYPKKDKELYRFDLSIEISKYNAFLSQVQWLKDSTILKPFIPEVVTNEIPFTR